MTATSIIVTKYAAHLVTDGAATMFGRLVMIQPKVSVYPHLGVAISIRGRVPIVAKVARIVGSYGDQATLKDNIAADLKRFRRWKPKLFGILDFEVLIAGYDEIGRKPWGAIVSTIDRPDTPAMKLVDVPYLFATPDVSQSILEQAFDMANGGRQVEEAAGLLVDMQRPSGIVGVFTQLTSVRQTIETKIVKRYDDTIGKPMWANHG